VHGPSIVLESGNTTYLRLPGRYHVQWPRQSMNLAYRAFSCDIIEITKENGKHPAMLVYEIGVSMVIFTKGVLHL